MSDDQIITAVAVTPGGEPDGKKLPMRIDEAGQNSVDVKEVLGDMTYVRKQNLKIRMEKDITLFAKAHSAVAAAADRAPDDGFSVNKDAGILQCLAGELATRAEKKTAKNGNTCINYVCSRVKCRKCPLREQRRVGKSKGQTYSLT